MGLLLTCGAVWAQEINPFAPTVTSVTANGSHVQVVFSVPVLPASATDLNNYSITNQYGSAQVKEVSLRTNGMVLDLIAEEQLPFMAHWLSIEGVVDALTGTNGLAVGATTAYTNVGFTTGYIKSEFYRNIAGTTIASLTNNPSYPDTPSRVNYYTESWWYDSTIGANYGNRLSAILVPPATGKYTFVVYSQGTSIMTLSTNEEPAFRTQIASCSSQDFIPSPPILLQANQHYYIEALTKEGTAPGDYSEIVWATPQSTNWDLIPAQHLGGYVNSPGATIEITRQPVDAVVYENRSARLSVATKSNSKIVAQPNYQWQLNGQNIPGATDATYTTPRLFLTNNSSVYRVLAFVPGAACMSEPARVTVEKDLVGPTCLAVFNFGRDRVQLLFSEPLDVASALAGSNYRFANGQPISEVLVDSTATVVTLRTTPMFFGTNYSIVLNGLVDQALVPNRIADDTLVSFVAQDSISQDIGGPRPASVTTSAVGGWDIAAGGKDIGGTNDQFNLNWQRLAGDFDIRFRLAGLTPSDPWAKAGLMGRETLLPGGRFAAVVGTPSVNGVFFESRAATNATAVNSGNFPCNYPLTWLRLQRADTNMYGYASYDGRVWTSLGGASYSNLPPVLYVGFATVAHSTNAMTSAQFRDLDFVGADAVIGRVEKPNEPLGPSSRKTPIVFSEVMYKPAPRLDHRNLEFIELYNSNPWFHDIGAYRVVADNMSYTIPAGTVLPGGGFLVLAARPEDITAVYGVTNVLGPYAGSLKQSGTLKLIDEQGAVLLTVPYSSTFPWPVAAGGAGHSLVLASPSYGEEDPRAWDISNTIGGSPGQQEPFTPSPLRDVVINEILANPADGGTADFIELYNHSSVTNDLSGCVLTDDPAVNKFVIPSGTQLLPGGFISFTQTQLGFGVKTSGETVYLLSPGHTRVLDAVEAAPEPPGVSFGRWPDGARDFYSLSALSPGTNNPAIRVGDVVINEIMYHPISGDDDEQYVELYNQGAAPVRLDGWQFVDGVNFTFPTNTILPPNGYLVVGRNVTKLFGKYGNLSATNTVGNFSGRLSHNSERLALARPIVLSSGGVTYSVEDEVTYGVGGQWGQWSSGGGSSLELIDPRGNHRIAANWGDSDETKKSAWTTITSTGILDNGSTYGSAFLYAQLGPLDPGECLVDDVEVVGTSGANLVKNPGFETGGLANWSLQGCMFRSTLENTGYGGSGHSLHIRCSSRVWTGANSCQLGLNSGLASGQTATLRFKARWLRGCPEILLRVKGNWLEAVGTMQVPPNLGTPGERNSRYQANKGPAVYEVTHWPSLPATSEKVLVTARVHDPDGLRSLVLNYRDDYSSSYQTNVMKDDGTGGDAIAGDGVYTGVIPAPGYTSLFAYYLVATDGRGVTNRFPSVVNDNAPPRECLVMFGDDVENSTGGSFGTYHLWISQTNVARWSSLPNLSNEMHDGTFVCGRRVIYNMQGRFVGSPYHQNYYSPQYSACHFKWVFPDDDKFLGATSFNKIHAPGNGAGDDASLQREQTAYTFMRALGVPWLNRRYVGLYVNGTRNLPLMEDTQCPDADMLKEYFPDDDGGYLYKMQPWFEFGASASSQYVDFNNVSWCAIMPYTTTTPAGRVKKAARYRYTFEIRRTPDSMSNFTNVFSLIDAASSANTPGYAANMENIADMENWMRVFAANHAAGNWDSFGCNNAQNLYGYIGTKGTRYTLMMFDFNIVLGNSGSWGPGENLFSYYSADSNLGRIYSNPEFRRMYLRALQELVDGPLDVARTGPLLDAKYDAFTANGIPAEKPGAIKNWLTSARRSIGSQIAAATNLAFTVNPSFAIATNVAYLSGTAPVSIKSIQFDGAEWPVTWTAVGNWSAMVPLKTGTNTVAVVGVDRHGQPVPGAFAAVTAVNAEVAPGPVGLVVFSEIMAEPLVEGAQFIELYNRSTNVVFDLSGWEISELNYQFPLGSLLGTNKFLVLAGDRAAYAAAYGATNPVFATFSQPLSPFGQTFTLLRPESGGVSSVVAQVAYEQVAPWAIADAGAGTSLQLVDPAQDDWRVGNWSVVFPPLRTATPGAVNTTATELPPFPQLWINEVQPENLTGITNSSGQRSPWVEIFNPSAGPVSLDGLYLADSYTNLTSWAFPTGVVLNAGEFEVVFADGRADLNRAGELHASFTLPAGSGSVALSRLDSHSQPQVIDYVNYTNLAPNHSYGSAPDAQSFVRRDLLYASPGGSNNVAGASLTVVINEWMADNTYTLGNPVTGKFDDWFELYNYGDKTANLSGYYLTHSPTNRTEFLIPAGYTIPPRGFLLVWADKKATNSTPELHTNFKLSKSGASIGLFAPDGRVVDFVTFGPQTSDVSMGRYPDGGGAIHILPVASPRGPNVAPNTAPVLLPLGNQNVTVGQSFSLRVQATDVDMPRQILTFSLAPGAPAGMSIDSASGVIKWIPTTAPATNWFQVVVADNGLPSLSASQLVTVTTVPPPLLGANVSPQGWLVLAWPSAPGQAYQVEYKEDLLAPDWNPLGDPIIGSGTSLEITNVPSSTNRFFRVRLVP